MRDAVDLAQRIDLDYDVIHTGYDGDECVSDTARRVTKRLGEGSYEVYVVASRLSNIPDEDHPAARGGGGRPGRAGRLRPGQQAPARR